ncbi:uncharacterized protein CBL_13550 [Carabus blaptoides fortunei]
MSRSTTIKEAIKKWEEKHPEKDISQTIEVGLQFQFPPIEKMDNSLGILHKCEKLSLSTNMIEKVSGIGTLKNLKILSLGRNYIKNFTGLEPLGDTLRELWISYNFVEKLKGVNCLKNLRVLYMSNNLVKEWTEFNKLQELQNLEELLFVGNPLYESVDVETWKAEASKRLPNLRKLDGEPVVREE